MPTQAGYRPEAEEKDEMQRKLMITVDVEAQPARAEQDPLARLIWGQFSEQQDAGIGRMMDIMDAHGTKMTMFLDYCEVGIYGEELLNVGREIARRGHDLQLHAHLDFLPADFWTSHALDKQFSLNLVSAELAQASVAFLYDQHLRCTSTPAKAFRGGGYRYNQHILRALKKNGVALDSSTNVSRSTQPVDLEIGPQFLWDNGVIEVPVSCIPKFKNLNRKVDFNFNASALGTADKMVEYLEEFYRVNGDDAIAVLVMHSWSLLEFNSASGKFTGPSEILAAKFDAFLSKIKGSIQIVTASDIVAQHNAETLPTGRSRPLSVFDPDGGTVIADNSTSAVTSAQAQEPTVGHSARCSICGASSALFVDLQGRKCPDCGSVERQRILAQAIDEGLDRLVGDLGDILVVSPSVSEKRIFAKLPHNRITSVDVRPDARTDIVADITSMPQIGSGLYDTIFASYVMMCVHDMDAALCEISRVLKPDGLFLSVEQVRYGGVTVENTESSVVQSWYGKENFEQYKVGSFRILGKDDYQKALGEYFDVVAIESTDSITGQKLPVYVCRNTKSSKVKPDGMDEAALLKTAEELWSAAKTSAERNHALDFFRAVETRFGTPLAKYRLGVAYLDGLGMKKDLDAAYFYLGDPSIAGWRYTKYYLGRLHAEPKFRGFDVSKARECLEGSKALGVDAATDALTKLSLIERISTEAKICPSCKQEMGLLTSSDENCPHCGSRARQRSIHAILQQEVRPLWASPAKDRSVLAFAPGAPEVSILKEAYEEITTASLYGTYGRNHIDRLDIRDMARCSDGSFDDIMGVCIFDYFPEHEKALSECHRVLRDGGVLYTHIAPFRLEHGLEEPKRLGIVLKTTDGDDAMIDTCSVGIQWFIGSMQRSGFAAKHVQVTDPATGMICDWFVGQKAARASKECSICGSDLSAATPQNENCPGCGARARTRTLPDVLQSEVLPMLEGPAREKPALGFSMSGAERKVMDRTFPSVRSVSLYGDYSHDNVKGVDVRDLSQFAEESFGAVMAILLFDYVPEVEAGLRQLFRVLSHGGVFATHIAPYRLLPGDESPLSKGTMKSQKGYFDYVPDGASLPTIMVGREWLLNTMATVGFLVKAVRITDEPTGMLIEWFIAKKPNPPSSGQDRHKLQLSGLENFPFPLPGPAISEGSPTLPAVTSKRVSVSKILPAPNPDRLRTCSVSSVLPSHCGGGRIELTASTPPMPAELSQAEFAEHVRDPQTCKQTSEVVVVGTGFAGLSRDMGETWRRIDIPQADGLRLTKCFTTSDGYRVLQALGWQGVSHAEADPSKFGALIILDPDLNFVCRQQVSTGAWHGTASIGQRGKTIMFAEYHNNNERYLHDFNAKMREYAPRLRRCGVFRSRDNGRNWELVFHVSPLEVRHFHTIKPDPYLDRVWWLSSGDLASESRVWRSDDDGDTWIDISNPEPDIPYAPSLWSSRQKCQRYTDIAIEKDYLLWGADDATGLADTSLDHTVAQRDRPGARIYLSPKSEPLVPRELAFIGNHIRKLVDIGDGWLAFTEASIERVGYNPKIFYINKDTFTAHQVMDVQNYKNRRTSFTTSLGSDGLFNNEFFTYRTAYDLFKGIYSRIAKYNVKRFHE